ncbi:MAG: nuclear transport factor 2 family protein [Pseudomonadota bacterium]
MTEPSNDAFVLPGWAHKAGMLTLGKARGDEGPDGAADRQVICERIARYCWAYDERRTEALSDCFTQDAVWEGNVLGRIPIGPFVGRDRVVRWLTEFWPHQHDQRRHMILNTIVERQTREQATTLSYLLLMSSDGRAAKLETTGFYRTDYRREDGMWRIERLIAGFDAPFWPGDIDRMSERGRTRHGVAPL